MAADGAGFVEQQLIKQLVDAGNELLQNLPASKEELLEKLQTLGLLLSNVYQEQSGSFHEALQPSIKALFADGLLQNANLEVKILTTYCMSEILRIAAPDQPCDDKSMEEFFRLAIMAFGKLANGEEDCCYSKAASILRTFAEYRLCVLMLDLELDALILEMFQLLLNSICPNNADALLPYMEAIMTMVIEDSEEISVDLLNILLTTAKKENQQSPLNLSYVLGETVFRNCNVQLQQYLPGAVNSLGIDINDYNETVQLTWQEAIQRENLEGYDGRKNDNQTPTTRRARKPNSLMRPEEGYDLTWINVERKSDKTPCQGKASKKRTGCRPPKHSVSMGSNFSSGMGEAGILKPTASQSLNSNEDFSTRESCAEEETKPNGATSKKSKKRKCSPLEKAARTLAEELVGCRIKVWVPKDEMFYEGSITSYDKSENKHKVNCDDGCVKDMNLSVERWEPIRDDDEQTPLAGVDGKLCPLISMFQYRYSSRRKCGFRMI